MKKTFGVTALLAILSAGVTAETEKITVAVYDFLTPSVAVRSYQKERAANPLEQRPQSLLTPAQMDKLPEEDRLAALRREQEELVRWQQQKRAIEVKRYEDLMEANNLVRDQLIKTEDGRAVLLATGMIEAQLGKYPAAFQIKRKRGGENANRDLKLENAVLGRADPKGGEDAAPTHYVEGKIGDLTVRELMMTDGPTSVKTLLYRLPVTLSLYEMASDTIVAVYDEELTTRDQVAGFEPKPRGEIMQELLRKATEAAAKKMYDTVKPAPAEAAATSGSTPVEKLKQLKEMLDSGLISQKDFDVKRADILKGM